MAGVEDRHVIDVVGQDSHGECMVVMVESRPWGSNPHQIEQLKAKINAYAGFIFDGEPARPRRRPEALVRRPLPS